MKQAKRKAMVEVEIGNIRFEINQTEAEAIVSQISRQLRAILNGSIRVKPFRSRGAESVCEVVPAGYQVGVSTKVIQANSTNSSLTVLAAYPDGRTKSQTAIMSGYAVNGGGFNNAISRLRTLELIHGRGELQASHRLFDQTT